MGRLVQVLGVVIIGYFGCLLHAQEIQIKVLNAHNGKPITDECLNVSLGKWRGAELFLPTNREGVVVLHLQGRQVTADAPSRACNVMAISGPKPLNSDPGVISVIGDGYIICQEYGKIASGEPAPPPAERIPTYRISQILESGVAGANTCGKARAEPKPGQLVLFARQRTFWEKMKL